MFNKLFKKVKQQVANDDKLIKNDNESTRMNQPKILSFTPASEADITTISDAIIAGNIVHVNFNKFSDNDKRRFKAFITGVLYATKFHSKQISEGLYIFSPNEIENS